MKNVKVWQLVTLGLALIVVGNSFELKFVRIHVHELLADVGALLIVVGALQFAFDEHARGLLLKRIENLISSSEYLLRAGIDQVTDRSHSIVEDDKTDLIAATTLVIGMHYSNTSVDRYTEIIRDRIATKRHTTFVISKEDGPGIRYLQEVMGSDTDLKQSVAKLEQFIRRNFENSEFVKIKKTLWLLKYNFVWTERAVWIIHSPNAPGRVQRIPAVRAYGGSPVYLFFDRDIETLLKGASDAKAAA